MIKNVVMLVLLLPASLAYSQADSVSVNLADTSQQRDTFQVYKPFFMHTVGVHVRSRYSYMIEYNARPFPHTEFKVEGGTADHPHYNLMGFSTTKTTGRYAGIGLSFLSNDYFKPVTSYHIQHGVVASLSAGFGSLHFTGEKEFEGNYYQNFVSNITEENIQYRYMIFRLGYEIILDRVVRFDIYPIQFTWHSIKDNPMLNHEYIPAIGVTRNGAFNPGFGVHIVFNKIKKKKK